MKINRRQLIQSATLAGLYYSLPLKAKTLTTSLDQDQFFVQILVPGGMDVTLSLDPQTHNKFKTDQNDIFIEYRPEEILGTANLKFGPACESLIPFSNECVVVNGIVMKRDVGHESLLNYISAGSFDSANLAIEAANTLGDTHLGLLTASQTQTGNRNITMTPINSLNNLIYTNDNLNFLDQFNSNIIRPNTNQIKNLVDFRRNLTLLNESINSVKTNFETEFYEIPIIIGSFLKGFSKSAILSTENINDLEIDLDTHAEHESNHLQSQKNVWDFVAQIFKAFKNTEYKNSSLFDKTTFVVMSEFSRTPYLNGAKGKDHNVYTNSVLIAGGRVQGGKSIGESKVIPRNASPIGQAIHIGNAFDFSLGRVTNENAENVSLIYPENLGKSFQALFNGSTNFYPNLSTAKPLTGIFK